MTTHYVEIRLLPDPEFSQNHLLSALYAKLHRALVSLQSNDIGVSFPDYRLTPRGLGARMRLHGTREVLASLLATDWLRGMRDHSELSQVQPVPSQVQHRHLQRRQFNTNVERMRRRRAKRKGETSDQAKAAIPDSAEDRPDLPYIPLRSASTGQPYALFLALGEPVPEAQAGGFNSFGLSQGATVPWF